MNPYAPDPEDRQGQYSGPSYTPPSFQQQQSAFQQTPRPAPTKAPIVDFSKFSPGQWLVLGGGIILLIGSLLPWYTFSYLTGKNVNSTSYLGWNSSWGKATLIIAVLTLALFAVRIFNVKLPFTLPATDRVIYMGLGGEALLLAVLYLFSPTGIPIFGGPGATVSPAYGLFLVLLAAVATAVGGYLHANSRPRY